MGKKINILRYARKRKKLTQQQVADALRMSLRSYQHYEYGERVPPPEKIMQLSELLDIDPIELLNELSGRNSTPESNAV
ncbi:MAG TPA: helix-turn-helix transcriptional regulator [Alicyclobacillus sp.]|nr:helix-turn-helix transcriptional regulator [Alicyclobacillus sp.]